MLWRMFCAPGERTFSRVKVPKPPGSGKNFAKGKGVRREAESEESRTYISSRLLPRSNSVNLETNLHQTDTHGGLRDRGDKLSAPPTRFLPSLIVQHSDQ